MTKFHNSNCYKTQKLIELQNSKTEMARKQKIIFWTNSRTRIFTSQKLNLLQNQKCEKIQTEILKKNKSEIQLVTKLKNLNFDKTSQPKQKLNNSKFANLKISNCERKKHWLQQNSKTEIAKKNSKTEKTTN